MSGNASLPVYVFVHGGGLREGSGSFTFYDGAAFAASNNVVVVTINYRLGPFGFLVPPRCPPRRSRARTC
jgi:para-nitrobenzyl esterase